MVDSLLSGYRALDLTDEKGFVCGKILGSMGVDVIKVESPGGDASRAISPYIGDVPDKERSLNWLAFNTDKRGITLDLNREEGKSLFLRLVRTADFIFESFAPGYLDHLGLGYASLSRINPRIVLASITPYGQKGPYSHYKGSNLTTYAMSGVMATNGDPDRAPVKEALDVSYYEAGAHAALGALIAHYHREVTVTSDLESTRTNRSR